MSNAKWDVTLSTTEPYNQVGLIKVRKNNVNTETIRVRITQNNLPHDLTDLKVYFCAYFEHYIAVEQEAEVINAKKGEIAYTLNQYDMKGKLRFAYFKFEKDDQLVGTTQNFPYTVQKSVEDSCVDAGSYIQRLEDVLNLFLTIEEEATKQIQQIIDDFNAQVIQQQIDFEKWFEKIKHIIEDIDPGGKLLAEIVNAMGDYDSLEDRLDATDDRMDYIEAAHYTLPLKEIETLTTLQDDNFSANYECVDVGEVETDDEVPGLIIAEVGNEDQDTFYLEDVGEIEWE